MTSTTDLTDGGGRRAATIYDVAAAAGVSHQTVSRFLQGYEGIRPATRQRVERALADLEYRPNMSARSLKSGRSHRIGALTHETAQVGPSRIAEGAAAAARDAGYVLDLVSVDLHNPHAIDDALEQLTSRSLAGVLALVSTDEMRDAVAAARFDVPVVIERESDDARGISESGMQALVAHLAEIGHRRLLLISGPRNWSSARGRERAFLAAATAHGLEVEPTRYGDWSPGSGYAAIEAGPVSSTAVVASNDQMALGAMLALKRRGLRVPDDISVVGVDDIPEAAYFDPPLTTVRNDFAETGRHAVHELVARIERTPVPPAPERYAELVVRESSAPPRG
ncbi:MAG: LacI family DNA-binding transcriptional regulator [Microbacterium arborescens]